MNYTVKPSDVYDSTAKYYIQNELKKGIYRIVDFRIPKDGEFYLAAFGFLSRRFGSLEQKPRFIVELIESFDYFWE